MAKEVDLCVGDEVSLRLALGEKKGTILESSESDVVLLKLESGYNIGIPKEKILSGRVLKRYKESKEKNEVPDKKGLPNIGMIITGGTIASKLDPKTGGVKHLADPGELAKFYPGMFEEVNVSRVEVPFMLATESMGFSHWAKIAETAQEMLNDKNIEGVIITQGTDFLHYTGAALSFMLGKLNKPVVLTYSQKSIDRASSDANLNLQCAAKMAISDCAEVMLVGHGTTNDDYCYAMPGTKVRKMHTSRRDAFRVINDKPIARVTKDGVEFLRGYRARNNGKVELDKSFSDKVALVKFYPGQGAEILDYYALKYKGVVIELSGLGHLPVSEAEHSWIPKLKKHIKNGFVVCGAAQTLFGRLDGKVYSNGRELKKAGVIFLEDMLPETALVKLGWVLGHHGWKHKVEEKMLENISGELNEKLGLEFL